MDTTAEKLPKTTHDPTDCLATALSFELKKSSQTNGRKLAAALGLDESVVSRIKKGRQKTAYPLQKAISEHFGYTVSEFITFGDNLLKNGHPSEAIKSSTTNTLIRKIDMLINYGDSEAFFMLLHTVQFLWKNHKIKHGVPVGVKS
jgi:transcriptional regulator with XRE-family HTH domain